LDKPLTPCGFLPGGTTYDLEWNNGTSFIFQYGATPQQDTCRVLHFDVGILRPNWLQVGTPPQPPYRPFSALHGPPATDAGEWFGIQVRGGGMPMSPTRRRGPQGATRLGNAVKDAHNCTVWAKADFITYYASTDTTGQATGRSSFPILGAPLGTR